MGFRCQRAAVVAMGVMLGGIGCSLLTDLDGFTTGDTVNVDGASADALSDAGGSGDGPIIVPDGASEGGRTCPSGRGPVMVDIGTFCIDSTEVTQKQYADFLKDLNGGPAQQPPECNANTTLVPLCPEWNPTANPDLPACCVDWCDAWAYCAWAGKRLCGAIGGGARIDPSGATNPTVSEWMAACTHKGERSFPYGATVDPTACPVGAGPHAVKTAPKCEGGYTGLFDMNGNVEEWENACTMQGGNLVCQQRGADSYGSASPGCAGVGTDLIADLRRDNGIRCCAN